MRNYAKRCSMLIGGDDLLRRRKRPLDGACLGRQLDGESRQGNAEASENLKNMTISPSRWFAGVFARFTRKVADTAAIQLFWRVFLRNRIFLYQHGARDRRHPEEVSGFVDLECTLRTFVRLSANCVIPLRSLRSHPRVNTRGSPKYSLHYRLPFLRSSASPREVFILYCLLPTASLPVQPV